MKRLLTLLLVFTLALLPLSARAGTVAASFYPIYLLALNLTDGIDSLSVVNIAPPQTGCLHDYQLSVSDMKALSQADVLLINGAGMESFLTEVASSFPGLKLVDASVGIPLLPSESGETEFNPHIWLSAANALAMAVNLAEGLMEAFPEEAEAIAANRDAYAARLEALDAELRDGLKDVKRRDIVTFHEAFPYFAEAYGLRVAAVVALDPDDALSPRQLASLIDTVRALDNPPLFTEPQYASLAAETVARETGAPIYELDPCVTGPEEDIPLTYYEDVQRANLQVLLEALNAD
ncbi:MAG: zinc ABC transporter substrate-binding protein [Clostridia bacterium]|nr:zinc ABC transporter substrate-binding protein [Clostridia bacterium]